MVLGRIICNFLERVLHNAWHIVNVQEMAISAAIIIIIIIIIRNRGWPHVILIPSVLSVPVFQIQNLCLSLTYLCFHSVTVRVTQPARLCVYKGVVPAFVKQPLM